MLLGLAAWLLGLDPPAVLGVLAGAGGSTLELPDRGAAPPPLDEGDELVSVVLADTEDTWSALFAGAGARHEPPRLVLLRGVVESACGMAQAAMGPFYCPRDRRVTIDLDFHRRLRDPFGAPGDFAQAYVIAHAVGHHVQTLLGVSQQVHEAHQRVPQAEANALSVRRELQADCYAGVWANHADRARHVLEEGDLEEGLRAAAAIGDDRIQARTQGRVFPETSTHGSSRQRVRWFRRGLDEGSIGRCDAFAADPV